MKISILIADDHPVFRKGLRDIIAEHPDLSVVGEVGEGDQVVERVMTLKPSVLLLDLNMPGKHGVDIAAELSEHNLPTKIIVLTMHKEAGMFNKIMDLGVSGYVLKESAVNDILASVKAVMNDEHYISPEISSYLMKRRSRREALSKEYPTLESLTATEQKILKLISEDKSSREIAEQLFISVRTVENHRMNICNKLNLHGSNGLLKFAIEHKSSL
jgi:DNA-binding NarL/FixJ family response regulator